MFHLELGGLRTPSSFFANFGLNSNIKRENMLIKHWNLWKNMI